ncbi:MAG: phosphatase PAP2 family protein [Firmicutes bacterium]|nr:phosphatase PAP2 family protein [Bacillota bacterium]
MGVNENTKTNRYAKARRAAGAAALVLFAVILACVLTEHTAGFDRSIMGFFYGLRCPAVTGLAVVITTLANKYVIIGICIVLLIVPQTRLTFGVPLSAGALGLILLNTLIKILVERSRPEVLHLVTEHGFSFPSGHSVTSLFFYGLAIWLVWRHIDNRTAKRVLTVLLAIPALLIGPTRIYLGVHFPTDVLAAWCLAFIAIIIVIEIINALERRTTKERGAEL